MRSFHSTVLLGNLRQAVRWAIDQEGGGWGGVFSRGKFGRRLGDRLQTSSGRNTLTCVYPQWKISRAWPLRSTRRFWKRAR